MTASAGESDAAHRFPRRPSMTQSNRTLMPLGERTDLCLARSYRLSSRSSTLGSAPATSSIFTGLRDPATSVTEPWPTPNAAATEASAAAVALPSTARSLTRTTRAPSCSPPTPGRADPGRTRTAMRTAPVCAPHAVPSASGPSRHHRPPAQSRDEAYRQPGATRVRSGLRRARAGLPPCTASDHRVSARVDHLRCRAARRARNRGFLATPVSRSGAGGSCPIPRAR